MSVRIEVEGPILEVTFEGFITGQDVEAAQRDALGVAEEQQLVRFLIDVQGAVPRVSTLDVFELYAGAVDVFPMGTRHAVVFSPETFSRKLASFGEDVCLNRGMDLKTFTAIDEATAWLQEGSA